MSLSTVALSIPAGDPAWLSVTWTCLGILLFLAVVPFGYPGRIKRESGVPIPEAKPHLSPARYYRSSDVEKFLSRLGTDSVWLYRRQLKVDIPFAIALAALLTIVSDALLSSARGDVALGAFGVAILTVPLIYGACDVLEDVALLFGVEPCLHGEDDASHRSALRSKGWVSCARVFTCLKFLFISAALLILLGEAWYLVVDGPAR